MSMAPENTNPRISDKEALARLREFVDRGPTDRVNPDEPFFQRDDRGPDMSFRDILAEATLDTPFGRELLEAWKELWEARKGQM